MVDIGWCPGACDAAAEAPVVLRSSALKWSSWVAAAARLAKSKRGLVLDLGSDVTESGFDCRRCGNIGIVAIEENCPGSLEMEQRGKDIGG